ncbi:ATP-binding protein [Streptomyces sp. N2-109]|uniref:ATP-binding protein n=1 Tax=Streptomyces gossypii TaxID=2883101 RepID=A0ABT2K3B4_9ACTN|nr:ATP-binding protein [Streptomyces gossypii]MCT2594651.1 ATP-binding protein [Streptomyces gossypii]
MSVQTNNRVIRRTARVEYALPQQDVSARWARRLTAGFLGGSRTSPEAALHMDDAALVVSELVTNATVHGDGRCRLRLSSEAGSLTIEVHDHGPGTPVVRAVTAEAEGGRGIAMVRCLAQRLDITPHAAGGKTIRAVLATA